MSELVSFKLPEGSHLAQLPTAEQAATANMSATAEHPQKPTNQEMGQWGHPFSLALVGGLAAVAVGLAFVEHRTNR